MESSHTELAPPKGYKQWLGTRWVGGERFRVHVYLPSWFVESCPLVTIYMQPFESVALRKLESSLTE